VLRSHRGWDPGALPLAREVARVLGAPLRHTTVTRLLVEPNRGEGAPQLFSEFTRGLPSATRKELLRRYHRRYRNRVRSGVRELLARGAPVLHLSVHTFTPILDGVRREVEVGVLFDPERDREAELAGRWMAGLREAAPGLRVEANAPYLGTDDGLTTTLRGEFTPEDYLGIEVEVRQEMAGRGVTGELMGGTLARAWGATHDPKAGDRY